jgi:hypothetical protein
MAYQYKNPLGYDPEADPDHDWFEVPNVFPDRFPILIPENSPAAETGTPVNDPNRANQAQTLNIDLSNPYMIQHAPPSYPSSSDGSSSIPIPDEPENASKYLEVVPAIGLGEMQHRRRASCDEMQDELNSSISRWYDEVPPTEHSLPAEDWKRLTQARYLPLGTRIGAPTIVSAQATRGNSSGSPSSIPSSGSGGTMSGSRSFKSYYITHTGEWIEDSMQSLLSYSDELAIEDDDDDDYQL